MIGHIIDVEYDDGTVNIAKITGDVGTTYHVTTLVHMYACIYKFSTFTHIIPKESVSGFYDTDKLEDTGLFTKLDENYYESITSDDEYEYESDSNISTDTEVDFSESSQSEP